MDDRDLNRALDSHLGKITKVEKRLAKLELWRDNMPELNSELVVQPLEERLAALEERKETAQVFHETIEKDVSYWRLTLDDLNRQLKVIRKSETDWRERAEKAEGAMELLKELKQAESRIDQSDLDRLEQRAEKAEAQISIDEASRRFGKSTMVGNWKQRAEKAEAEVVRLKESLEYHKSHRDEWHQHAMKSDMELDRLKEKPVNWQWKAEEEAKKWRDRYYKLNENFQVEIEKLCALCAEAAKQYPDEMDNGELSHQYPEETKDLVRRLRSVC